MYDTVLFPTDGSDATNRARRHAIDLARQYDATLHVLSVVTEDPYRDETAAERASEEAERTVETVANAAREDGVDVTTAVRQGVPHEAVLDYADEAAADMIVMGTHGRTGVDRAIIGSVTERVVRTADVPVVTIRMTDEPTIHDADEAEELAIAELSAHGYDDPTVTEEPYRTTGSWIVPAKAGDRTVQVHIDATSGSARIARLRD
ncbi:universal stress protein [Haloarchaeobius salinus]|uniref:universal stress protein n=1 Tax=Haloarchaeobius salinus TaxID=1198298 RepID=UPI00210E18B5|nr:universal stress protein [Haloarchaeobius salinus]